MLGLKRKRKAEDKKPSVVLKRVLSAWLVDGGFDMVVVVDLGAGEAEMPFTYVHGERSELADQIAVWLKANRMPVTEAPLQEVTADMVKAEARRRIREIMPSWMVERQVTGGAAIPAPVLRKVKAVRSASNRLEQRDPIPANYAADEYWP